jgi:hypothetical protein
MKKPDSCQSMNPARTAHFYTGLQIGNPSHSSAGFDYNGTTNPAHKAAGFPQNCLLCHTMVAGWGGATLTGRRSGHCRL